MRKHYIYRLLMATVLCLASVAATAQEVVSPCPEVLIDQKYDHVTAHRYRIQGWDTAVTCSQRTIELTSEPFIPVQYFNGTYLVEEVPFNPPDPSFAQGTRMPLGTDDDFADSTTTLTFPFFFFGIRKDGFRLGANGLISFATNQFGGGNGCPWKYSAQLPWTPNKAGVPTMPEGVTGSVPLARMRDAIYGIYEDTHPLASYLSGQQGIYYGIQGEWPCRKIICSWNGIPTYAGSQNLNNRCTYQIVCYEGSNIIEVHVKRRGVNTNWQGGRGLIGIQNATGVAQERDSIDPDAPNRYVQNGSPAFFCPEGKNVFTTPLDTVAYRFTPQGQTPKTYVWYRITAAGDSIPLSQDMSDPNGYYVPMGYDPMHPTRTKAVVSPRVDTRYVLMVYFRNANLDVYRLRDTISVGVDTVDILQLQAYSNGSRSNINEREYAICRGAEADVRVQYTDVQLAENIQWTVSRIVDGVETPLDDTLYSVLDNDHTVHFGVLPSAHPDDPHYIDSLFLRTTVDYVSGCPNHDTFLLRVLPTYDVTDTHGICAGDTLHWAIDGHDYTATNHTAFRNVGTADGCDSVVHLDLTVFGLDKYIVDTTYCEPIEWNGRTYSETNTATSATDTVRLVNVYGCDSIVQLRFTLAPVVAKIGSDREEFTLDELTVQLTDLSTGNSGRTWLLPSVPAQYEPVAEYTIPIDMSEADIRLVAHSPYGCTDTARLVIPLNKETFWIPNIFTPNDPDANNTFGAVSTGTFNQEIFIYNRYGEMVFHCLGDDCRWDGTDTHGRECVQGAYVYIIRYNDRYDPSVTKVKKGTVTLIR